MTTWFGFLSSPTWCPRNRLSKCRPCKTCSSSWPKRTSKMASYLNSQH